MNRFLAKDHDFYVGSSRRVQKMVPKPDPYWIVFLVLKKKRCSILRKKNMLFNFACGILHPQSCGMWYQGQGGCADTQLSGWWRVCTEKGGRLGLPHRRKEFFRNISGGIRDPKWIPSIWLVDVGGNRKCLHLNDCHKFPWAFFWKIQII